MSRYFEVPETKQTLAGIEWRERYACYTAKVANWLEMSFNYSNAGYHVTVAGKSGKEPQNSAEDAAKYCVKIAKQLLTKAQAELNHET